MSSDADVLSLVQNRLSDGEYKACAYGPFSEMVLPRTAYDEMRTKTQNYYHVHAGLMRDKVEHFLWRGIVFLPSDTAVINGQK